MILDTSQRFCGLQRLVYANHILSASIFLKSLQMARKEGESNGSGLNRSLVNDLINHQSIGYGIETFFKGVEDALHNGYNYMKLNFVYSSGSRTRQNINQVYLRKADVKLVFGLEPGVINIFDSGQDQSFVQPCTPEHRY